MAATLVCNEVAVVAMANVTQQETTLHHDLSGAYFFICYNV